MPISQAVTSGCRTCMASPSSRARAVPAAALRPAHSTALCRHWQQRQACALQSKPAQLSADGSSITGAGRAPQAGMMSWRFASGHKQCAWAWHSNWTHCAGVTETGQCSSGNLVRRARSRAQLRRGDRHEVWPRSLLTCCARSTPPASMLADAGSWGWWLGCRVGAASQVLQLRRAPPCCLRTAAGAAVMPLEGTSVHLCA